MTAHRISRRRALQAAVAAPFVWKAHAHAAPSETVLHASVGAGGMAWSDIKSLTESPHLKLVAVADVDLARTAEVKKKFPDAKIYTDWREMFEKEKFDSVNVSTPDHTHAVAAMRALQMGKATYTQKPLTQTIAEARKLTETAAAKKAVTQMGIQIHSHPVHRAIVEIVRGGAIGKVTEVHSWSGKTWGDPDPKPNREDPVPQGLDWDKWLGVAEKRPFIGGGYYHPGNWRKRLDFGTGTFGDMGCHILDPVFESLGVGNPTGITSDGDAPNEWNWGLNGKVRFTFPGTKTTAETVALTWYHGKNRPPEEIVKKLGERKLHDQGSIYLGTEGILYSPYIAPPVLLPEEKFKEFKHPVLEPRNHYLEYVDAVRGKGTTSAPFSYSGPLTELVLLGCLATRFPGKTLEWNPAQMKVTNLADAGKYVERKYRMGFEENGL